MGDREGTCHDRISENLGDRECSNLTVSPIKESECSSKYDEEFERHSNRIALLLLLQIWNAATQRQTLLFALFAITLRSHSQRPISVEPAGCCYRCYVLRWALAPLLSLQSRPELLLGPYRQPFFTDEMPTVQYS